MKITNILNVKHLHLCKGGKWLVLALMMMGTKAMAQPKTGYYTAATLDGKSGRTLELALKSIVYPHTRMEYGSMWELFKTTDPGPVDSIPTTYTGGKKDLVYDMYAWMGQFPKFYSDINEYPSSAHGQTGGYNREHSVPNSWWGGESGNSYAYTDLHHLVPSDGAANNAKSDYALGEYKAGMTLVWPKETKTNTYGNVYMTADTHKHVEGGNCPACASHIWKTGNSTQYGGSVNVYEPANEYKGDFARMYLYLVCAYEGELTWETTYMFTSDAQKYTTIKPWAKELLLKWHRQDPVSDKERKRNNAVYSLQKNRNPFIDYPELVEYIWGEKSSSSDFALSKAVSAYSQEYINANGGGTDNSKQTTNLMLVLRAKLGERFSGLIYSNNSNGAHTYTSSNPDVATVDAETGVVTIKAAGETIITYTVEETENFKASKEQYGIIIDN